MKWRRLKYLEDFEIRYAHRIAMVCSCLHNLGLRNDGWLEDANDLDLDDDDDDEGPEYEFRDE